MQPSNFRNPNISEPRVFGNHFPLNTHVGVVPTNQPPLVPPRPFQSNINNSYGNYNRFNLSSFPYSGAGGGYGTFGGYGYNNYNNVYGGGYGFGSSTYPEQRFITMAEENSRSAFQNIESLVGTVSNIAAMLDSTFFALTSSFRAVLGVASNFAHLRGVFAQLWTSFALFRWIIWTLYLLRIRKTDPSIEGFKDAFRSAEIETRAGYQPKGSSAPILLFLGFIMSAPYLLMKLFGNENDTKYAQDPKTWQNPIEAVALYNFNSSNPNELTIYAGERLSIAPRVVQTEHNLINTGWVLASKDSTTCGLIPISYVQGPKQQPSNTCDSNTNPVEQNEKF
ncbi:peroxisomal membrane protein PEX13 isoform X2 [Toxorhynchites rutilus septentrionalis]|uniref:peroxisomal membrane protein PEX13 isoform X2 n=1 Tax=Toxorhynchites rutilus septentrionalis TaxID=329112 RepID=UPI002479FB03|nr:peroxisomal membrane protein PEX13 isoform X2 [Toxorhynchites rutilus septentrionalis]